MCPGVGHQKFIAPFPFMKHLTVGPRLIQRNPGANVFHSAMMNRPCPEEYHLVGAQGSIDMQVRALQKSHRCCCLHTGNHIRKKERRKKDSWLEWMIVLQMLKNSKTRIYFKGRPEIVLFISKKYILGCFSPIFTFTDIFANKLIFGA